MTPKAFAILAALTLRLVDEPAFPSLRAEPDAVAKIVVTTPSGTITLVRETGERWAALERYGYPVDRARVRELVVALADMRLIERKTAQPEHYHRLQVEDPGAAEAKSHLVRLESADGTVLAEAIIGKQRHRLTGTEPSGIYLRRPGEATSWLASGGVQVGEDAAAWLDDQIVDLNGRAIERISVQPAAGPGYVVARADPGSELRVADLAAGEAVREDADLARLSGALSGVRLEDVKPRDQLSWPDASSLAQVRTFDGLELTVRLAQIDDGYWATFDARPIAPAAAAAEEAASGPEAAPAQEPASEETAMAESAPAAAGEPVSEEVAVAESAPAAAGNAGARAEGLEEVSLDEAEAPVDPAELGRRLGKWAFRIPEHLYDRLTTGRSELVTEDDGTS